MSEAISCLSSNLSRWDETRPSPKASLKNKQNEMWTHRYEHNVTTFVTKGLQLSKDFNKETPSKYKAPSLPLRLSSVVPEEANLLSFLQADTLPDITHVIAGVAQTFTYEVPAPERKLG